MTSETKHLINIIKSGFLSLSS